MTETEEYFPRGGKKPTTTYFKQSENFLGAPDKGEKKRKRQKKKSEDDDGYLSDDFTQEIDQSYKTCGIFLNYRVVKEGLLLLGRVRRALETKILVSLPCRMSGVVMACHISDAFNNILEAYVNDKVDQVRELPQMFRLGQYVAVKVLEASDNSLTLTMMPQDINSDRKATDLHKGALIQAAVTSIEDHGYVMDIGIPNTRAFLAKDTANSDMELDIGMLTWVTIKSLSADSNVVTLSSELGALQRSFQRNPGVIYPGTAVDFTVHKALDNGIEGHILNNQLAYIQRHQIDTVKGKKPALGQKIRARLLYSVPPQQTPFLTMREIFDSSKTNLNEEQIHQDGDVIEEAKVLKSWGRTVFLRLSDRSTGFLSLRRGHDFNDHDDLAKSYPIGSTHRVRVLCYNLSDYVYSVSDDPALLRQKYFNISQLSVGELVSGTVTEVADQHLRVAVDRISGYVPRAHMTETGVFIDPKKPRNSNVSKKYKVGQEVQARVLVVDETKNSVVLTLKPSLLAEDLPLLMDYSEAHVGKMYTGVISHIKHYLLVSFFNNVVAYVPSRLVGAQPGDLADAFHTGQIVKCTIMSVKPEAKKMSGSLVDAPFQDADNEVKKAIKRKNESYGNQGNSSDTDKHNEQPEDKIQKKKRKKNNEEKLKTDRNLNEEANCDETEMVSEKNDKTDVKSPEKIKKNKKREDKVATNKESETKGAKNKNEKENINKKELKKQQKNKDNKKNKIKRKSEESHETQDGVPTLNPIELRLVDLSDCDTEKHYKKRVVSLMKAINARLHRIERVDKKMAALQGVGPDPKKMLLRSEMHLEKTNNEDRLKLFMKALREAEKKLSEFNKDSEIDNPKEAKVKGNRILKIPSAKEFWKVSEKTEVVQDDSSSSDDEEEEKPKKKRKKLSAAEKAAKVREEEERLREMEKRAIDSESSPRSSEQFERALLAQPDCSQLWIAYMAFHLQATEIEKARAVARKALNTINFREEGEKLNVWLALLNLEHRFGTKETQQKTLEDALQMNDTYSIHSKLLDILVETSKQQELTALVELMMRKYKTLESYVACGEACYKSGMVEKARHVMQRGIVVLEKKEHVSMVVKFAVMERARGVPDGRERCEALLEQMLATYPQRVDVIGVYCDMLCKEGDVQRVRQLMERMTAQKMPARKMKVLYKKWIEVEQKIGDEEHVELVRQNALKFLDKAKF
ncbi:programmed cell death 11 protein [Danaus plexippus plexippus]|uniref:rRNA biogenesis protein RRP5 n=1 Tax=Danaus plexippus plexippus TaxID=278856 RepID=A0A212EZM0_DANPL|nr:programmed cell death 11 protein [Danaus plexippus plexippus]